MTARISPALLLVLVGACAGSAAPPPPAPPPVVAPVPPPTTPVVVEPSAPSPVARGELPWWHDLEPGIYIMHDTPTVLAVGRSVEHHHVAEGFLKSKVIARLGVRKAAEPVGFSGTMPEPEMSDLFITRDQRFFALYRMPVPEGAALNATATALPIPADLQVEGRHRLGRHVFEGPRHLYLECDVEGPIANPDWGRTRATAALDLSATHGSHQ